MGIGLHGNTFNLWLRVRFQSLSFFEIKLKKFNFINPQESNLRPLAPKIQVVSTRLCDKSNYFCATLCIYTDILRIIVLIETLFIFTLHFSWENWRAPFHFLFLFFLIFTTHSFYPNFWFGRCKCYTLRRDHHTL